MPDGPRYDDDFYAWTQHQAEVLRSLPVTDDRFDREHVAEEIEDLGKSERDAVRSQIRRIIEHLLKLGYSPAKEHLHCVVWDSGPGIAPEDIGRLFRRFSQIDGSTARSHGGTGLGLAICKGLVELMDGKIGVRSEVGRGSEFWFEIPAHMADDKLNEESAHASARTGTH